MEDPPRTIRIHQYVVLEKIANGRFGTVCIGKKEKTGEKVALKIETRPEHRGVLQHETRLLHYLYNRACRNIPYIYWFGLYQQCPVLVIPYYEYSLFDLYTHAKPPVICADGGISSRYSPARIVYSLLQIIQTIHEAGVVHRDIKPHNFMVKGEELFLIDFGMATFYIGEDGGHRPEPTTPKTHLLGTLKYISYHVHLGCEYSRRDDLISIGYVFLFIIGRLWWSQLFMGESEEAPNKGTSRVATPEYSETHILHPKNQGMRMAKRLEQIEDCFHRISPPSPEKKGEDDCVREYLRYVYSLTYSAGPDYARCLAHLAKYA
jgi:serine/threonine protein kinase